MAVPNLRTNASLYSIDIIEFPDERLEALRNYILQAPSPFPDCNWARSLFEKEMEGTYFILRSGGAIVGYAITKEFMRTEYVWFLCTNHTDYKGAGVVLLNAIKAYGRQQGRIHIELKSVSSATLFYKKQGFVSKGRPCGDYEGCIMKYDLLAAGGSRKRKHRLRRTRRLRH